MKTPITTRQYFITLNFTYYLQAFSVLVFTAVVAFLILQQTEAPSSTPVEMWHTLVPVLLVISLATSYMVFRMMVGKIKSEQSLQKKMPAYARALLIRSALLELPGFLAGIAGYLTSQLYFLGGSILIFILFLILRPSRGTITHDLNLSAKEKAQLEDDNAVIAETERR